MVNSFQDADCIIFVIAYKFILPRRAPYMCISAHMGNLLRLFRVEEFIIMMVIIIHRSCAYVYTHMRMNRSEYKDIGDRYRWVCIPYMCRDIEDIRSAAQT